MILLQDAAVERIKALSRRHHLPIIGSSRSADLPDATRQARARRNGGSTRATLLIARGVRFESGMRCTTGPDCFWSLNTAGFVSV